MALAKKAVGGESGDNAPVRVRRDWNDHRIGTVKWPELRDPGGTPFPAESKTPPRNPSFTVTCGATSSKEIYPIPVPTDRDLTISRYVW